MGHARLILGNNLKSIRNKMGLNQESFAQLLGMKQAALSQLESGSRGFTSDSITAISEILGIEAWELLRPDTKSEARLQRPSPEKERLTFLEAAHFLEAYGMAQPENRLVAMAILKEDASLVESLSADLALAVESLSKVNGPRS